MEARFPYRSRLDFLLWLAREIVMENEPILTLIMRMMGEIKGEITVMIETPFLLGRKILYTDSCVLERRLGRGGEIIKQLRADSKSKIRIGETVRGCEERVVTIYSSSEETNRFVDADDMVCPVQDALFREHDRVVADDLGADENMKETPQVTAKLLVPSDSSDWRCYRERRTDSSEHMQ